ENLGRNSTPGPRRPNCCRLVSRTSIHFVSRSRSERINLRRSLGRSQVSHSHTYSTVHPFSRRSFMLRASLATFALNFASQKARFACGVYAYLHPLCLCQKQPFTKIAVPYFGMTISGLPGRSRRCR